MYVGTLGESLDGSYSSHKDSNLSVVKDET